MGGACSVHGDVRNACEVLVRKLKGKRPFGGHMRGWEDNIKMHLKEIRRESVDWIHLT
jgi:hypothetical protein